MQIQNFYTDWLPASSSPLDSIVLSPHTIRAEEVNLNCTREDYCKSPSRLCAQDLNHLELFAHSHDKSACACQLKRCFDWLRNRCADKKEIQ
jgi:hypothetical protein